MPGLLDKLKSWCWSKLVGIAFREVFKDFQVAFENRDKTILSMAEGNRKEYYARCQEAAQGGALQAEAEDFMNTLYKDAALGQLSDNERTSKRYAMVVLGQLLKRIHALGARSKPASSEAPIGTKW